MEDPMPRLDPLLNNVLNAAAGLPRNEAQTLAAHALGVSRTWVMAHGDEVLTEAQAIAIQALCTRRLAGEPMAFFDVREFYGRDFCVSPATLIPRPETELLVSTALSLLKQKHKPAGDVVRVLDLGTGSGAIAISIALESALEVARDEPTLSIFATDFSQAALEVAKNNAQRLGAKVEFAQGDWFAALEKFGIFSPHSDIKFDAIVSNPPYIAADDTHLGQGDLRFEPRAALCDEADGLACYRTIVLQAPLWLKAGGFLLVEHGWTQSDAVCEFFAAAGFKDITVLRDFPAPDSPLGTARAVLGFV